MKYFLDTEFIEKPGQIQLISIGIASEDGRTFYAENTSFDEREADEWVWENVLDELRWWGKEDNPDPNTCYTRSPSPERVEVFGTITSIKDALLAFFTNEAYPEFWGYYADYDWVIFCWIFGKMIELPKGFPMYCRDLKQLLDESGKEKIADPEGEHNALVAALWNKALYEHLTS